jgi:tRNA (guanine-N7-)-methyltransferase
MAGTALMRPRQEPSTAGERAGGRPRRIFGRRRGRLLRPHQASLMASLLPQLALDLNVPPPPGLAALFAGPVEAIEMEIGFGGGEHLRARATAHPERGFIGCEPFVNGVAKLLCAIEGDALRNIRLHHGDACDVLAWLPDSCLTDIFLLYPDPWPKRRHWKRRLITDATLATMARVMRRGAHLRFASDSADYVHWTLLRGLRCRLLEWTAISADDWRQPWPDFSGTRYEDKARREGRAPVYLVFRRL